MGKKMLQGFIITTFLCLFTFAAPVFAYIDPGSGSVLTSAIIGLFAAVGYTVRKYFYKIVDLFKGGKKKSPEDASK
jgi:uncharacterized membrane protein